MVGSRRIFKGSLRIFSTWAVAVVILMGFASTRAQFSDTSSEGVQPIPTIIEFASTVQSIPLAALESGGRVTTLSWHVIGMRGGDELRLEFYRGAAYVIIHDQPLPASGVMEQPLEHPGNFAPPTYRLSLLDAAGTVIDQRTLVIDYETPPVLARLTAAATPEFEVSGRLPRMETVSTDITRLSLDQLAAGAVVNIRWQIANRIPNSLIVFEQMIGDGETVSIEPPRDALWLPSQGEMTLLPLQPTPNADQILIRARVIDLFTGVIYDELVVVIPVGTPVLPTIPTDATPLPTLQTSAGGGVVPSGSLNPITPISLTPVFAPTLPAPPGVATATLSPNTPQILTFRAVPPLVSAGESTVLTWDVNNAVSVEIQEIGEMGGRGILYLQLPPRGSLSVMLPADARLMRYLLIARGADGAISQQEIIVAVNP